MSSASYPQNSASTFFLKSTGGFSEKLPDDEETHKHVFHCKSVTARSWFSNCCKDERRQFWEPDGQVGKKSTSKNSPSFKEENITLFHWHTFKIAKSNFCVCNFTPEYLPWAIDL